VLRVRAVPHVNLKVLRTPIPAHTIPQTTGFGNVVTTPSMCPMRPDERDVLELAIRRVTEQATNADATHRSTAGRMVRP
jgi:hypothetical protein